MRHSFRGSSVLTTAAILLTLALVPTEGRADPILFNNGASSGPQTNVANMLSQRLFENFTLGQNSVVTGVAWQQHDERGSSYVSTEVLIFSGLPFSDAPLFNATLVATVTPNATGTLFEKWDGFDYAIGGLSIALSPGTYWLGLNTTLSGGRPGWDNTLGEPDSIPGFRLVNAANPAPGALLGGNLAFTLYGDDQVSAVPEPGGTLSLLAVGFAAAAARRRRRR
jgi:hypothetical protein